MQSTSWEILGWIEHKLESRLLGEISITSDMQMTPPYGRKWRGTKEPLDEGERGEWKCWLNIRKIKVMASGPITSWQIDREKVETVDDFIFLVSKITVDRDCSNEIKRLLLLGNKIMTNLDSILKSRDITLTGPKLSCICSSLLEIMYMSSRICLDKSLSMSIGNPLVSVLKPF